MARSFLQHYHPNEQAYQAVQHRRNGHHACAQEAALLCTSLNILLRSSSPCNAGDMYLFDAHSSTWSRISACLPSMAKLVPVRHTSCVAEGTLYVIGGGAMCFSFGSTFSEVSHYPSPLQGCIAQCALGTHNTSLTGTQAAMIAGTICVRQSAMCPVFEFFSRGSPRYPSAIIVHSCQAQDIW